jgi:uncharacterized protein YbjT (DUF2867 family)
LKAVSHDYVSSVDIFHLHNAITENGGGETLSVRQVLDDVARLLSDAIGKPVVYEALTEDEAVRELIENGLPEAVARTRVEVHRGFSTGAFAEVTGNVQTLLHRAPRSFAEFARDYTSAFR